MRIGKVNRKTNETKVDVEINLDGAGKSEISSGVGLKNCLRISIGTRIENDEVFAAIKNFLEAGQ